MKYDDDYGTCEDTYATLHIDTGEETPSLVTSKLKLSPSEFMEKGTLREGKYKNRFNRWFLTSKGAVKSKDSRRHIDWILDNLEPVKNELLELQLSVKMDIGCFWLSTNGDGGPTLSPYQMRRLADLNLEVWWDVYVFKNY
jgi:hypothetical protein